MLSPWALAALTCLALPAPFAMAVVAVGGPVVVVVVLSAVAVAAVVVVVVVAPVEAGARPLPLPGRSWGGAAPEEMPTTRANPTAARGRTSHSLSTFTRWNTHGPNDDAGVSEPDLLALYDKALPQVFGYLVRRCPSPAVAEDLTAETFLAAVAAVRRGTVDPLTPAWLIGVARHKLVDFWRRSGREAAGEADAEPVVDPDWTEQLEPGPALDTLQRLAPHHRLVLTLRYLDGLPVPEVAAHLDRTVHATEALLVRAKAAFRRTYHERRGDA